MQAVSELDEEAEKEAAIALARKKWPALKGEWRQRQLKLTGYLLRRGFPNSVVRSALDEVRADSDEGLADEPFEPDYGDQADDLPGDDRFA